MKPLMIFKRFILVLLGTLSLSQCTMLIGSFDECEQTADCWQLYERNDLSCQEQQCVIHELYSQCQTIVGNTDSELTDDEVITFGAVMAMSTPEGASNPRGEFRSKALELGYGHFNQRGGVNDKEFRVRVCDHQGDSEKVAELTEYLVNERKVPLLVTSGSQDTINASTVTILAKTLLISISATSPELRGLNDNGLVWRMSPSDALVGKAAAESVNVPEQTQAPSFGIIYISDVYGDGLQNEFKKVYQELYPGASVSSYSFQSNDQSSIDNALSNIKDANPSKLFVIAFSGDGSYIANQLASNANLSELPRNCEIFFADSVKDQTFLDGLDSVTPSVLNGASIFSVGELSGSVFESFQDQFESTYSLDPSLQGYLAQAYDLAFVSALASHYSFDKNASIDGTGMAEAMSHFSSGEPYAMEAANITNMVNELLSSGYIDIQGASGDLTFDPNTGDPDGVISTTFIIDGSFEKRDTPPDICSSGG